MSSFALPRLRNFYYGWVMVLTLSLTETVSWGILYYTFSVFIAPMQAEFGWSVAQLTGAYSLAILLSGLAALPVGRWLDRHGPRLLMTAGSILATLLVLAWSRIDSLAMYYLVWIGIGLAMAAVLYEPALQVIAVWFRRKRSRALTILTFVGGFASVIFIPLAGWLLGTIGWRDTLVVLAVILGITTIPLHALVLRRDPSDMGLTRDGEPATPGSEIPIVEPSVTTREAVRSPVFWWLTLAFVLTYLANIAITTHLIPYLIRRGFDAGFAAFAAGLIGAFALPGRLIFTPLGGRVRRHYIAALIFALQTLSIVVLLLAPGEVGVLVFVALFGAGFGAITPARAALVADIFGSANYGTISGVLTLCITVARAAGPVGAGLLFTILGSYTPVLWVIVVISALASAAALAAKGNR